MPKAKAVDRATATIKKVTKSDAQKVDVGKTTVSGILGSPNIGAATDVAANTNKWSANITALEANAKVMLDLRAQAKAASAKQRALRRQWAANKKAVLASITLFGDGSADVVQTFTTDVITQNPATDPSLVAPYNLVAGPGTQHGQVFSSWASVIRGRTFVVQWATDIANLATYSANIAFTKKKFPLAGQPTGSVIHFRVAYQDSTLPDGHGLWSPWVSGTVK